MTKVLSEINAKIGAPADYLKVAITEYNFSVEAIDPHKRENVDEYSYQVGTLHVRPVDVSSSSPDAVQAKAFKGDTVKPAVLARTMASAPQDSKVENARVELVVVSKYVPNADPPQIHVSITGPRASKTVNYDLTGQLLNVS